MMYLLGSPLGPESGPIGDPVLQVPIKPPTQQVFKMQFFPNGLTGSLTGPGSGPVRDPGLPAIQPPKQLVLMKGDFQEEQ